MDEKLFKVEFTIKKENNKIELRKIEFMFKSRSYLKENIGIAQ